MRIIFLALIWLANSCTTYATHAAGMDISYECISQGNNADTYKITLKFYRDCEGIPAPGYGSGWQYNPLLQLEYSSSCGSGSVTLQTVGSIVNINSISTTIKDKEQPFNLEKSETKLIKAALTHTNGNRTEAAKLLGISRRTLQRKIKDNPTKEE